MINTFPETLAPNFFHVDKLPDYGLKLFENELGREIRRYTEDTGYKTELKIQYNGLRSAEVKALTAFYLQVKGTFDKFTLPINFYRCPSSITNSLTDLADTTEWRFMNPPMIQTVISDIYTVEIRLLSLKESLNPDSSKIIGFVNSVNMDFILPTILIIPQQQVTELVPIALEFIVSSIDLNQSVTVNSIDLTLETSELTFTTSTSGSVDSRSIQSLSLSFVASQTGFVTTGQPGGGFTPKDISNLFAWYQDDNILRVGNNAAGWIDLSNNKNDALESDFTRRPSFAFNQINGKNVVRFSNSGINQLVTPNMGINSETSEFSFVVLAKIATLTTGVTGAFISNRPLNQVVNSWFSWGVANQTGEGNPPNRMVIERRTIAGVYNIYIANYSPNNTYAIYTLVKQNNALNIYVNGSNVFSLSGVNTGGGNNSSVPWRIGNWFSNNQNLNGDIPFFCIYTKALSGQEQSQIENYITSRYAL